MRSVLQRSLLLSGAFLVFAVSNASASWNVMKVTVPFPFVVQGQTLPAGQYLVEQEDGIALLLRGEKDNHVSAFIETIAVAGHGLAAKPTLIFTHDDHQYRLSAVKEPGDGWSVTER